MDDIAKRDKVENLPIVDKTFADLQSDPMIK